MTLVTLDTRDTHDTRPSAYASIAMHDVVPSEVATAERMLIRIWMIQRRVSFFIRVLRVLRGVKGERKRVLRVLRGVKGE